MRWGEGRRSDNVEDRRGGGFPTGRGGFPRGGFPGAGFRVGRGGLGIGGVLILVVASLLLGIDPMALLGGDSGGGHREQPADTRQASGPGPEDEPKDFVSVVLADTEDTWNGLFARMNQDYEEPRLVLFSGVVESACGTAQAAVGPFYCPLDRHVYIDLSFYRDLRDRFRAPGDFAQAYVIAHEVGHHVQTLLGISERVRRAQSGVSQREANALSVRQELQADCFAGLWAHHAQRQRQILEPGDVEEALTAASAIGDDRLQRRSSGTVTPDSFTHGSSEQRVRWFRQGFERGEMAACDTFAADRP